MNPLVTEQCRPIPRDQPALSGRELESLCSHIPDWSLNTEQTAISRVFKFKDYYATIAFANAVAWIAQQQDHHPELNISYNLCHIIYTTHSRDGLSRNDFICASRIDTLLT